MMTCCNLTILLTCHLGSILLFPQQSLKGMLCNGPYAITLHLKHILNFSVLLLCYKEHFIYICSTTFTQQREEDDIYFSCYHSTKLRIAPLSPKKSLSSTHCAVV